MKNRHIVLRRRPHGPLGPDDTAVVVEDIPVVGEGEALFRLDVLAMDPAMRIIASVDIGVAPIIALGTPLRGFGIGTIVQSRSSQFTVGARVTGVMDWADYQKAGHQKHLQLVPDAISDEDMLNIHGHTAMAAYFGMLDVGYVSRADDVLVSGAAGAVGSIAGQIAKIIGARVVGIAGGPTKCRRLTEEFGFDAAIDYKAGGFGQAVKRLFPNGIDLFFDNVSGDLQDEVAPYLNNGSRIVACGFSALAESDDPLARFINPRDDLSGARILPYDAMAYVDQFDEAAARMRGWRDEGKLKVPVMWLEGLTEAPDAMNRLFDGRSNGRVMIKLEDGR